MTAPQDRLAASLLAVDDLDVDSIARLVHDDSAFPEVARIMCIADEWLHQDIADGQALRLLRDALPSPSASVMRLNHWRNGSFGLFVDSARESWEGKGATIAEAADACREALEASA